MPECDDCVSDGIYLISDPVPFGDIHHSVAHVSRVLNVANSHHPTLLHSRYQLTESFHLVIHSHTMAQHYCLMKVTQLSSTPTWQHPTGVTLTTGIKDRSGMKHTQLNRAQTLTCCWNEYQR